MDSQRSGESQGSTDDARSIGTELEICKINIYSP